MEEEPRTVHDSECYARAALDGLTYNIAILDAQGRIELVNQAWRNLAEANLPTNSNVCEGSDYLQVCDGAQGADAEDAQRAARGIRDVLAGRVETSAFEYPCHSPDVQRWFNLRITRVPGPGPARVIVVHENVTERKLAEDALRASEERFRDLTERTSDWVWEVDEHGVYTYASPRVRDLLGYQPEEVIGKSCFDLMSEDEASRVGGIFSQILSERAEIRLLQNTLRRRDGGLVVVETSGVPIVDESGALRGYRGIDRDITERKQAEEALARAAERDHHIADMLQQTLIPPQVPMQIAGYEIAARYQPALSEAEVCGDFYDLIDLVNGKLCIVIGDIVGKGLSAAARVAAARQTIRSYALLDHQPSSVMTLVNNALCRDLVSENDMLTAFFAVLDTHSGRLTYTNAGHEPPLIRRSDGRIELLTEGGPMLSSLGVHVYPEGELTIEAGDLIVLVTDGITEARIAHSPVLFGEEGIVHYLYSNAGASAEEIASGLLESAAAFANGQLRDDAAIVVVKKLPD